ncbi:MAG: M28 family peptidase, partial [Dokdonella sp.]
TASLGAVLETFPEHAATMTLFADAGATYAPGLQITTSTTNPCCSDHRPYLDRGVPALLSIHKNYASYPHYHKTTDTPTNLGAQTQQIAGAILRMNVAAIAQLGGASDRIFADGFDSP